MDDTAKAEALARRFHEAYERLAPQFGYETRTETRDFNSESANGKLMIAVCAALSAPESVKPDEQFYCAAIQRCELQCVGCHCEVSQKAVAWRFKYEGDATWTYFHQEPDWIYAEPLYAHPPELAEEMRKK